MILQMSLPRTKQPKPARKIQPNYVRFREHSSHYWGRAFIKPHQSSRADILQDLVRKGDTWGHYFLDVPDEVDALDAGDVLRGHGMDSWRRLRRVRGAIRKL